MGDRRAEQRAQLVLMARQERSLEAAMRRELKRAVKEAAAAVADGGDTDDAIEAHERRMRSIWVAYASDTYRRFGKRLIDRAGRKDAASFFEQLLVEYIREWGARKVTQITTTTASQIRDVIREARGEGLGVDVTAKRIRDQVGGAMSQMRAHVIARTETHSAAMSANTDAVDALRVPGLVKEWVSASDERVREDHAEADGQKVGKDEYFTVGGARLLFPGDPSAPPEQVIMCRCVQVFALPD